MVEAKGRLKEKNRLLIGTAVALITVLVFLPSLTHGFVNWDDGRLLENLGWRGFRLVNLRWWFTAFAGGDFKPLAWASYAADFVFWGLNPAGFHLANILIHALNAFIFYCLLSGPGRVPSLISASAALFFSLHPLRVESVSWVTERKGLLCAFFCLLSVACYLRYSWEGRRRSPARPDYFLSLLFALFACLSKPIAVSLPLVIILLDLYPRRPRGKTSKQLSAGTIPFFILAAFAGSMAFVGQERSGALAPLEDIGWGGRVLLAVRSSLTYLGRTLYPSWLRAIYYDQGHSPGAGGAGGWSYAVLFAFLTFVLYLLWRKRRGGPLWCWCLYLAALLPVSGLFRAGMAAIADRFSYLPALALSVALAGGLVNLKAARGARLLLPAAAVLSLLAFLTIRQEGVWKTSCRLWERAVELEPTCPMAFNNLGNALAAEGRNAEASAAYEKALRLKPDYPEAHVNLGNLLAQGGRPAEAAPHYLAALRLKPDHPEAHNNLGNVLAWQGKVDEAILHFQEALRLRPGYAEAHHNLGNALTLQKRYTEAEAQYREALRLKPDYPDARQGLAKAQRELGEIESRYRSKSELRE